MQVGMIGLGRMGSNMALRLLRAGHDCVVFDRKAAAVDALRDEGAIAARSLEDMVALLAQPRAAWLMLPAGNVTQSVIDELAPLLAADDVIIDGGNTHYKDDVRRACELRDRQVSYVDVGTSGGVWGLERGYSLMIGGDARVVARLDPLFRALAPGLTAAIATPARTPTSADEGYLHCGPAGAGHYVKMVHNGIEYGLMQAYAEGFDLLQSAANDSVSIENRYEFEIAEIAEVWRRGSVIGSWLLDLTAAALAEDSTLQRFTGSVDDSGEARWMVAAAMEAEVPVHAVSTALYARFRSRRNRSFGDKLLSAMREQFGGHRER